MDPNSILRSDHADQDGADGENDDKCEAHERAVSFRQRRHLGKVLVNDIWVSERLYRHDHVWCESQTVLSDG